MVSTGQVSLQLTAKEARLLRKCAEWNNTDITTVVQYAVIKKVEKEYDLDLFNKTKSDHKRSQGFV